MDSDDESEETTYSWQGTSGCIILINCFDPLTRETAKVAYEAASEMVRQNMRRSHSSLIGVCLYGTKDCATTSSAIQNMVQMLPLATPSLENFKTMLLHKVEDFGQASELKLSDVLWHCSKMFKQCNKRLSERTVIMLTRLDIPPTNLDATKRHQTLKRVMDLKHLGIDLKVINISKAVYKEHPFYKELLDAASKNINDVVIPKPVWEKEDIQQLMQQHTHRHVALARLSFDIGDGISIGVGVYKLIQPCPKPKSTTLSSSTNEILTTTNKTMRTVTEYNDDNVASDNAYGSQDIKVRETPLLKSETIYYQVYGNEKIEFTQNELDKVKNPFPPRMLKLLGFKPHNILCKEKWFLKQCAFLFPNESIVEGSTVAFKALHQACTEEKMLPICVLCSRANTKPQIVALSPCKNPLGLNVDIGFDIIYIPFLENLKHIPDIEDHNELNVDDALKGFMGNILKSLKFEYQSDTFENPVLQCMYRGIEALALEENETKPFHDTTKQDPKVFECIDAQLFEELFGPFGAIAPKRPPAKTDGPRSKKALMSEEIDTGLLESRISNRQIHKYTVPELRHLLQWKKPANLPPLTGLKKDNLINLVYEAFDNID